MLNLFPKLMFIGWGLGKITPRPKNDNGELTSITDYIWYRDPRLIDWLIEYDFRTGKKYCTLHMNLHPSTRVH